MEVDTPSYVNLDLFELFGLQETLITFLIEMADV